MKISKGIGIALFVLGMVGSSLKAQEGCYAKGYAAFDSSEELYLVFYGNKTKVSDKIPVPLPFERLSPTTAYLKCEDQQLMAVIKDGNVQEQLLTIVPVNPPKVLKTEHLNNIKSISAWWNEKNRLLFEDFFREERELTSYDKNHRYLFVRESKPIKGNLGGIITGKIQQLNAENKVVFEREVITRTKKYYGE